MSSEQHRRGPPGMRRTSRELIPSMTSQISTSTLAVDPPSEIAWTGTTMRIKAVHVFRFEAMDDGTLARSEESWEGLIASMLKGYRRRTLDKGIRNVLASSRARRSAAPPRRRRADRSRGM